jgi:hypothetical protein
LNFTPKIPFHVTGLHSNSDVETHAPWWHGGGATAFGLNSGDAINPAFGDRSKAVT